MFRSGICFSEKRHPGLSIALDEHADVAKLFVSFAEFDAPGQQNAPLNLQ